MTRVTTPKAYDITGRMRVNKYSFHSRSRCDRDRDRVKRIFRLYVRNPSDKI